MKSFFSRMSITNRHSFLPFSIGIEASLRLTDQRGVPACSILRQGPRSPRFIALDGGGAGQCAAQLGESQGGPYAQTEPDTL